MVKRYTILFSLVLCGCSSEAFRTDSALPGHEAGLDGWRGDGAVDVAPSDLPGLDSSAADLRSWPDLGPDRPHQAIEHLTDDALRSAIHDLVKNHHSLGYDDAKAAMFTIAGGGVDVVGGTIECVYTGITAPHDGTKGPGTLNTEHSWPKSDGADTEPATSDLHHLFPCDNSANSYRGSLPFGDTDCPSTGDCIWSEGGSAIGSVEGGTARVFMVRPSHRGDIARAHFYFAVRYQMPISGAEEKWLRIWNLADAPDQRERDRAAAIESLQLKRNPFVDRPDFVDQIGDF